MIADDARRILLELDVGAMRALHRHLSPHLGSPGSDWDVLASMHLARTTLDSIPLKARHYSHFWLIDRNLPSQLPGHLLPKPDQVVPRIVEAVGVMVAASSPELQPAADRVRDVMNATIMDAYADSASPDPKKLQERMMDARRKELRGLMLPDKSAR